MLLEYCPSIKISVIVTCHNYEKYLQECLDSIFRQTRTPDEVIIVNDKPNDPHLINKVNTYTYTILNTDYGNPLKARYHGLKNSQHEYFCFVDADDKLQHNYLKHALNLIQNDKTDLVYSDLLYFDQQSSHQHIFPHILNSHLISVFNYCHVGCITKKAYALNSKAFDHHLELYHEDWVMWRRIINSNKLRVSKQQSLYCARRHDRNKSTKVDLQNHFDRRGTLADNILIVIFDTSLTPIPEINFPANQVSIIFVGSQPRSLNNKYKTVTFIDDLDKSDIFNQIKNYTGNENPEYILLFNSIKNVNVELLHAFDKSKGMFVHNSNFAFMECTAVSWPPIKDKNLNINSLKKLKGVFI